MREIFRNRGGFSFYDAEFRSRTKQQVNGTIFGFLPNDMPPAAFSWPAQKGNRPQESNRHDIEDFAQLS
jgi:hypothetical protein